MYDVVDATLYAYKLTRDSDGYSTAEVKETECMARTTSVNFKEFYDAYALGIKPSMIVIVDSFDYEDAFFDGNEPSRVKVGDDMYKIIRAFSDSLDYTQLTVERDLRNGNDNQ